MKIFIRLNSIAVACLIGSFPLEGQCSSGIINLWNGKDFTGWELVANTPSKIDSVCTMTSGGGVAVAGKPVGYLATVESFENYSLHMEYRWPLDALHQSNSGVLVHIASPPADRKTWPVCFQIQTKITRTGDVLPMAGAQFAEPLSSKPGSKIPIRERQNSDSENSKGKWNTVDILCSHKTIECRINGIIQNRVTNCEPCAGKIGFQLEGFPFELRNIWLMNIE